MKNRPCPTCGSRERVYWHWRHSGWLEVMCGWCGESLHGVQAEVLEGGKREVA